MHSEQSLEVWMLTDSDVRCPPDNRFGNQCPKVTITYNSVCSIWLQTFACSCDAKHCLL